MKQHFLLTVEGDAATRWKETPEFFSKGVKQQVKLLVAVLTEGSLPDVTVTPVKPSLFRPNAHN